jgi:hypothetical protein
MSCSAGHLIHVYFGIERRQRLDRSPAAQPCSLADINELTFNDEECLVRYLGAARPLNRREVQASKFRISFASAGAVACAICSWLY